MLTLTRISVKCLSPSKNLLYISMTGLVTGLDALTDILSTPCHPLTTSSNPRNPPG